MRTELVGLVLRMALALVCSGCAPIQWWDSGTNGPAGVYKELSAIVPAGSLGKYKNVEVLPFDEEIPHLAPSEVVTAAAPEIAALLQETKLFLTVTTIPNQPPAGTLVIKGTIIYYDPGEINDRVLAMSGESELIGRVSLVDKETNTVIGTCDARGIVKTTFNQPKDVSLGLAKGVVRWIQENHPLAKKNGNKG